MTRTCRLCGAKIAVRRDGAVHVELRPFRPDHLPGFQSRPVLEIWLHRACADVLRVEVDREFVTWAP
jgi:hypothetical protein